MLATIDFSGATLTLSLGVNESVVVSNPAPNQIRFNVSQFTPPVPSGGFGGPGSISIGAAGGTGTTLSVTGTGALGGTFIPPATGITAVTGSPIGFSVVGYGVDTTATLPSAVSLVIKGQPGSAQVVDFRQSTSGALTTASRVSIDLGNDANDDVTLSGAIDRSGVVSGDALRVTGVDDVVVNGAVGVATGNVVIHAAATNTSSIAMNAGVSTTTGSVTFSSRSTVAINGAITAGNAVNVTSARNIKVSSNILSGSGGVTLNANQQATPSGGGFIGIDVRGAAITTTGNGNIVLRGRGGDMGTPWYDLDVGMGLHGVAIGAGSVISSGGTGSIVIEGRGGVGSNGIRVATATLTTSSYGGGSQVAPSSSLIYSSSQSSSSGGFSSTSSGMWVLTGAGNLPTPSNHGVWLDGLNTKVSSVGGAIDIGGQGGVNSAANYGIKVSDGARVESTGNAASAAIRLNGVGSSAAGVGVSGAGTRVTTVSGPILIQGNVRGSAGSTSRGVSLESGGVVESTGATTTGTISIVGVGGPQGGGEGVMVRGASTRVTSVRGAIAIAGRGGKSGGSGDFEGVALRDGAIVESTGAVDGAPIAIVGVAGTGPSGAAGVLLGNGTVRSVDGSITVKGKAGDGHAHWNNGVLLLGSSLIESTGASTGGSVVVEGTGGGFGAGVLNDGVRVESTSRLSTVGGAIHITGVAGAGESSGVSVQGTTTMVSQGSAVRLVGDSMTIGDQATVRGKTVNLTPRSPGALIDLGGSDDLASVPPSLGLSNAELNRVVAETLVIGAPGSGSLVVTAPIELTTSADVALRSGADIAFTGGTLNSNGGRLFLAPGNAPSATSVLTPGVDAKASSVVLASALAIAINGRTVDSEYTRLKVDGAVNLNGANLVLGGSNTLPGEFVIVESSSITGTFNGLPNGSVVTLNGVSMVITYARDRVTLASPSNVVASLVGRALVVTGDATSDSVQILPGPNSRSYVIQGLGRTTINGQPRVVVRNVTAGWRVNLGQGNDTLIVGNGTAPITVTGGAQIDVGALGTSSQVRVDRLAVSGALTLRSSAGLNEIVMTVVTVGGQFTFTGSNGDDFLTIRGSRFSQAVSLAPGQGTNRVTIGGSVFQRAVVMNFAQAAVNAIDAGLLSNPLGRSRGNTFAVRPQISGTVTRLT